MIKLLAKWTLIVCLNAVISFYFALSETRPLTEIFAMVAGVFTFIGIYMALEQRALRKNKQALAKRLTIATCLKACTQFFPMLEVWAGIAASIAVSAIIPGRGFFQVYFITLLDGLLLSIVVGVLMVLLFIAERIYRTYQEGKNTL